MIEIAELAARDAARFRAHTFPMFGPVLESAGDSSRTVAVGAQFVAWPVGLALARIADDGVAAEILSLHVDPLHRGRGCAKALLLRLEEALAARGCRELHGSFVDGKETTPALVAAMRACGWDTPVPRMRVMHSDIHRIAAAPFLQHLGERARRRLRGEVFDWHSMGRMEGRRYARQLEGAAWVAPDVAPFAPDPLGAPVEPLNSLGLQLDGRLAGWMVTHRTQPDTIRYTRWCVEPGTASGGAAAWLLAEAIRRQVADGSVRNGTWVAHLDNRPMQRFIDKRLAPWLTLNVLSYGARKAIGAPRMH